VRRFDERAVVGPVLALAAAVILGLVVLFRRGDTGLVLIVVLSTGLVCLTPWPSQFARYLTPLSGLLAVAAVVGIAQIHEWLLRRPKTVRRIGQGALALLLLSTGSMQGFAANKAFTRRSEDPAMAIPWRGEQRVFYHSQAWKDWETAALWLTEHSSVKSLVATTCPHLCYLWTGRKAIFPPMEANPDLSESLLREAKVDYLIVDGLEFLDISRFYAQPAVDKYPDRWSLVYTRGEVRVYERR
jgi:hypothetical protein